MLEFVALLATLVLFDLLALRYGVDGRRTGGGPFARDL